MGIGSFKLIIGILFGLIVISVASLGVLYQQNFISNNSSYSIRHTLQILDHIDAVSALYKDIQLESNGLFISRDSAYILPYNDARQRIFEELSAARTLTKDNANQTSRIDSLDSLLRKLIVFTDSVLRIARKDVYTEKSLLARINANRVFRKDIGKIIADVKTEEKRLLAIREKISNESMKAFNRAFFVMLLVISILLITTFISIRYSFNKRIRAEMELKKANDLFFKLFHESPVSMVISRLEDGVTLDCNNAYSELVNYSRAEIIGRSAVALKVFNGALPLHDIISVTRDNGTARGIEVAMHPRGKESLWVSISMQSIQIQNTTCILSAILDMTVHKRAEEKMVLALAKEVELNKMKSNFVALASHEFRTPLTAILSSAVLLEKYAGENQEKASKHAERIKSSVNTLTSILNEFLSLTKIEEDKISPTLERLNLKEWLRELCLSLKSSAKPGQKIIYNHNGEMYVWTDPTLVTNIVTNLVSNAIKYSDSESDIYVSSLVNHQIHIKVKDSGIGIPEQEQKKLFDRFYRASNAGNVQGTGLGLHITKHYVEMLHGSIQVSSELGKGTEFEVILKPVAEMQT